MQRKHAFTLVELLVVIGIIALLISILLPSLNRARWQAKIVQCSARMHDVVLAVNMYANDNKGALPPFTGDIGQANFAFANNTIAFMFTETMAYHPVNTVQYDDGALLGRLYVTKYLRTNKTFFCPASNTLPANPDKNFREFSNYMLNPHVCNRGNATLSYLQPWWKRLPNYGKVAGVTSWSNGAQPYFRRAILTDPMVSFSGSPDDRMYISHAAGTRRAFNMGYPDGSVLTYVDNNWTARRVDRWATYLDLSNAIQHNLDGGNVNFASAWQNGVYNSIPLIPN